jgi:hypothetical protein
MLRRTPRPGATIRGFRKRFRDILQTLPPGLDRPAARASGRPAAAGRPLGRVDQPFDAASYAPSMTEPQYGPNIVSAIAL